MNKKALFTTKWITYTAMLTALVIATNFIPPIPSPAGRIYWVDGVVLTAAFLMDPLAAFIIGGVGSLLYDVIVASPLLVGSLFIHGLQGAIVSALVNYVFPKKREPLWAGISAVIGAVEVIVGYLIAEGILYGFPVAVAKIPRDIIQEIIGITFAMLVCYASTFKRQLKKSRLLPDFKKEVLGGEEKRDDASDDSDHADSADSDS